MPASRPDLAIDAALRLNSPLVELLVREGVSYTQFAAALKTLFIGAAEDVLTASGAKVTDSSLSTLSGVHRKDVHAWREAGQPPARAKGLTTAMTIFARWKNDPEYADKRGRPRVLDRHGKIGSFDALAYTVSKDVRPNAVLMDLLRLGIVREAIGDDGGDQLVLCADAFVPKQGNAEMLQLFAENVADHIASGVNNLMGSEPMLEQSLFAEGFTNEAVEELSELSRKQWQKNFKEMFQKATELNRRDKGRKDANRRFRMGMYSYRGPAAKGRNHEPQS